MSIEARVCCDAPGCEVTAPEVELEKDGAMVEDGDWIEVRFDDGASCHTVHGCSAAHAVAALAGALDLPGLAAAAVGT